MADIEALWSRLEAWASQNAPQLLTNLNPGATADEIRLLESELELSLPDSIKASLAIHNGEDDRSSGAAFVGRGEYLSTSRIVEEWRSRQESAEDLDGDPEELIRANVISVDGPVQPKMFAASWVPILDLDGHIFLAIDLAPAPGGQVGQIIEVEWEGCSWRVLASSFEEFFTDYLTALEGGELQDRIALLSGAHSALADNSSVRRFRFAFGVTLFLIGLLLFSAASESGWFYVGVFAMAWGGWVALKQVLGGLRGDRLK